jgi:ribose 5-phosphate isomerase B
MRIALGADHAGFDLKEHLRAFLVERGDEVDDLGTFDRQSTDYPDWAARVAASVAEGRAERGLLVCGSGVGMAIAANRRHGVRAVATGDLATVRLARAHNDVNVLALGARLVAPPLAETLVEAFLESAFEGGRHERRVLKLDGDPR